jgi:hypothetical protein
MIESLFGKIGKHCEARIHMQFKSVKLEWSKKDDWWRPTDLESLILLASIDLVTTDGLVSLETDTEQIQDDLSKFGVRLETKGGRGKD